MKTVSNFRLGQFYYGPPFEAPRQPVLTQGTTVTPGIIPSAAKELDKSTRDLILGIISSSKDKRDRVAQWWASTPNVREVLGDRMKDYSQYLSDAMAYDSLMDSIETRLKGNGPWFVTDSELNGVTTYQKAVDNLIALVEAKAPDTLPASSQNEPVDPKALALTGGVAFGSLVLAALL